MTCPFFFFQQRSAEELLAKCKKLAALFSFTGKVLLTFPRFTSRRIMEKSNLRWAQSNWRIYVSVFYSTHRTKLQYSPPQNLFFFLDYCVVDFPFYPKKVKIVSAILPMKIGTSINLVEIHAKIHSEEPTLRRKIPFIHFNPTPSTTTRNTNSRPSPWIELQA